MCAPIRSMRWASNTLWNHSSGIWIDYVRLRGGRQGATAPPAPPARSAAPGNPDSMQRYAKRLARMPLGRYEQEIINPGLGTTEAYAGGLIMRQASFAGGLGGGSPSQRGARGAE